MGVHSRIPLKARAAVVVIGGIVLLAGLAARSLEEEHGAGIDGEMLERDDGTVAIYDFVELDADYEIVELDETSAAVYETPFDSNTRTEVFRGTHDEASEWWEAKRKVLVFDGPRAEALAWDEARHEAAEDMLVPNLITGAGALILLAALFGGWSREQRPAEREEVDAPT